MGKRLVSFVAVPDEASEANARRVFRHLHRQTALAHAGSASEHDQRAVAAQRTINHRANRVTFSFSPDEFGSFGERKRRNLQYCRRDLPMIGTRSNGIAA